MQENQTAPAKLQCVGCMLDVTDFYVIITIDDPLECME
jgi:hypothetical protein